jgi:hypothetical protein
MATTVECARCHDHKYDAVLHKDYYRLQAFFTSTRAEDDYVLVSAEEQAKDNHQRAEWEEKTKAIRA